MHTWVKLLRFVTCPGSVSGWSFQRTSQATHAALYRPKGRPARRRCVPVILLEIPGPDPSVRSPIRFSLPDWLYLQPIVALDQNVWKCPAPGAGVITLNQVYCQFLLVCFCMRAQFTKRILWVGAHCIGHAVAYSFIFSFI